ncbi:hypothetical protein GCM10007207_19980 [Asaia siamensis]|uniref:Uncharacterized protein n=2 Tax=Asaia siamensis TaxID=110479 RepID=A0ABQ1M736_9PROT|nr:hypothetical protein AA0323_1354 [Asaia siamensis NRIC 0323]GGC34441.1 hypothetical protein GCM10007207_19980 [Asaia siamensis]
MEMARLFTHGVRGPNAATQVVHRIFDEVRAFGHSEAALAFAYRNEEAMARDAEKGIKGEPYWRRYMQAVFEDPSIASEEEALECVETIIREFKQIGAAEQRRKDAEGAELVAWCLMTADGQIINGIHEEKHQAETYRHRKASDTLTPLYTRPASVTALEDRVKELEGVNKAWSDAAANALTWLENGRQANARDELKAAQRRAAAIREGGEHG